MQDVHERVEVESRTRWYPITGNSARAVDRSLRDAAKARTGSGGYYGRTTWNVRWRYTLRGGLTACRLDDLEVDVEVVTELPSWKPASKPPGRLREQWGRFERALVEHERGHEKNGREAGEEVLRTLRSLPPAATCAAVEAAASQSGRNVLKKFRALDERYDSKTQHGRTQGAVFPPP